MPSQKSPRKNLADRIHDRFYAWFGRSFPESNSVVADGFTRRSMRDAYEAGFRAAIRRADGGNVRG